MENKYIKIGDLKIAQNLFDFVNNEVLPVPGTDIDSKYFWFGVEKLITDFADRNRLLLKKRDYLQTQIDQWHKNHEIQSTNLTDYKNFLYEIGYLSPFDLKENFSITTTNVDDEIAKLAGPQLVVPLMNARFTLNATNARWGSLYDALYGTDVIPKIDECDQTTDYNPVRGQKVIDYVRNFLDDTLPLCNELKHSNAVKYWIESGNLKVECKDGRIGELRNSDQWIGYRGSPTEPVSILFIHHGLHIDVLFDRDNCRNDPARIKDVFVEAALTTIVDCEDSVAAVDIDDKIVLYQNWLGLMKGNLQVKFDKGKQTVLRQLNPDRLYTSRNGTELRLSGRSLLFIRHVGHHLYTDAILDQNDQEIPEGILDALICTLIALHNHNQTDWSLIKNSRHGSIYIVKPKQHGPEEVEFTCQLFDRVEEFLNLPLNTMKLGIMDEERRTTLNLAACIHQAKDRVVFINTGFLDRTGDEIHTSMYAGPMRLKSQMKDSKWFIAYEKNNVNVGLRHGLSKKAQIGKGMWPIPDCMDAMMKQKNAHLEAGASCSWVPSPTAATLHALHYHKTDVFQRQCDLFIHTVDNHLDDLLSIPLLNESLSQEQIQRELDNNAQSILGYVVRWIDQGIGCSKIPDIYNVGLMEDRATLRISSQHMANWLKHGIISKDQVIQTLERMARIVDRQNGSNIDYRPMSLRFQDSIAFQAALELILEGDQQPNGYTEHILHRRRRQFKKLQNQNEF